MTQSRLERGVRAIFTGMAVNTFLAGSKLTAGILGHSHSLAADGVESLSDVFSSVIVWRGLVVAAEPADEDHPYGHGKADPIAAGIASGMLLLAAVWIGANAITGLAHPRAAPAPFTLLVLALAVILKEGLFRFVQRESVSVDSSAMHSDAWHHRSDAITSLAAAIGISVALLGGPGWEHADDIAAIVAALIIAFNGWRLLRRALHELMDRSPQGEMLEEVRRIAGQVPGVEAVEKCFVRKMGNNYYVDMHVEVDPQMTVRRSHEIAHEVKDRIRGALPAVRDVLVHIEPTRKNAKRE